MIFAAIIFCERDFTGLARTLDTPFPKNVKHVVLLGGDMPQKYEIPPKLAELLQSGKSRLFCNSNSPETLAEIYAHLREIGADIWFFLRAGDTLHRLHTAYLQEFFACNSAVCGVVFAPVLSDGISDNLAKNDPRLPKEFCNMPQGGLFPYNKTFPQSIDGAAVWASGAEALDVSKGADAWLDLVEKTARGKGKFGRLFRVFVDRKAAKTVFLVKPNRSNYLVSCIIPIYKVEKYLEEAIESVVAQTIGFEDNVQLILVNDGSPDGCGEICKMYAKKYPANVVYIEQENRGVSAARNAGLDASTGEFLAFLDGDDRYDEQFMSAGIEFLKSNRNIVDFVVYPIRFFEKYDGDSDLNYRFDNDKSIVDLNEDFDCLLQRVCDAMFVRSAFENIRFDTTLKYSEDGDVINRIILNKMKCGILRQPFAYWRLRAGEPTSAIQTHSQSLNWYNKFESLYTKIFNNSITTLGFANKYAQYFFLYELEGYFKAKRVPDGVDGNKLYAVAIGLLKHISDDVIMQYYNRRHQHWITFLLFKMKYGKPILRIGEDSNYYFGDRKFGSLNAWMIIDSARSSGSTLKIIGRYSVHNNEECRLIVTCDDSVNYSRTHTNKHLGFDFVGIPVYRTQLFEIDIQVTDKNRVRFYLEYSNGIVSPARLTYAESFPISRKWGSFCICGNLLISSQLPSSQSEWIVEQVNLIDIKNKFDHYAKTNFNNFVDAEFSGENDLRRNYYQAAALFSNRRIWLFSDGEKPICRKAENLFRSFCEENSTAEMWFIVSADSPSYGRLSAQYKNLLIYGSHEHKLFTLFAEKTFYSTLERGLRCPFADRDHFACLIKSKFIYLHPGVFVHDVWNEINGVWSGIDSIVVTTQYDKEYLLENEYGFDESRIHVCNIQSLSGEATKTILLLPVLWNGSGQFDADNKETFAKTDFFDCWNRLIQNATLNEIAKQHGYSILFRPEDKLRGVTDMFSPGEYVNIPAQSEEVTDLMSSASIVITDYSSLPFEFATLRRPIIYYHGIKSIRDYYDFDYQNCGLGEVAFSEEDLINCLSNLLDNNLTVNRKYAKRTESMYHDVECDIAQLYKEFDNCGEDAI